MQIKTVAEINKYTGRSVNPMDFPDQLFELYSVPCFETGYPEIIKGKEIGSTKITVEEGDVLICKINPRINRVWVVKHNTEHPLLASSEWIVVRNNEIDSDYLKCYFSSPTFRTLLTSQVAGIGGSLTRAQPKQVAKYPVPVPNALEQERISNLLNDVSRLISLRKEQLAKLDQLVKARFVEMFGEMKSISEPLKVFLEDITYGFTNPMPDAEEGPWKVTAKDVINGKINYDTARKTTVEAFEELTAKSKPAVGDVLLTKDGTLGRCAVVEEDEICVNQSVAVLKCNNKILPKFLAILLQMPEYQREMLKNAGGGTIKHIYITKIVDMQIMVPAIPQQIEFLSFVEQSEKLKTTIQQSLDKLEVMKKAMMQEYFGQ